MYHALEHTKAKSCGKEGQQPTKSLLVGGRLLADSRVVVLGNGVLVDGRVAAGDHACIALKELAGLVCVGCQSG